MAYQILPPPYHLSNLTTVLVKRQKPSETAWHIPKTKQKGLANETGSREPGNTTDIALSS